MALAGPFTQKEHMNTDTKAAWKRRALRAEAELSSVQAMRNATSNVEHRLHRERAALTVSLREVDEAIQAARDYIEGGAS